MRDDEKLRCDMRDELVSNRKVLRLDAEVAIVF